MYPSTGILTVDLAAIQKNWQSLRGVLGASTTAAAVIKADAYGLGADRVGPALAAAGCRTFFVATLEEGLAARKYLPDDAEVVVLGGAPWGTEPLFIESRLKPVLYSPETIKRWQAYCRNQGVHGQCVIKVDTGMTRLGLDYQDFPGLCAGVECSGLAVDMVMSHLACADEPAHPLNRIQLQRFQELAGHARVTWPGVRLSLANSCGVFLGQDWHVDLVRPGAALYGINPRPGFQSPIISVVSLRLPILQQRQLMQEVSLGYGAGTHKGPPAVILAVAGGYADGLHRVLGPAGEGMLAGYRVPVVGRISMDSTLFDASGVPVAVLGNATHIEILNTELTVDQVSARNRALGYEVLTSLAGRYQRQYLPANP